MLLGEEELYEDKFFGIHFQKKIKQKIIHELKPQFSDFLYDNTHCYKNLEKAKIRKLFLDISVKHVDGYTESFAGILSNYFYGETYITKKYRFKPIVFDPNYEEKIRKKILDGNRKPFDIDLMIEEEMMNYNYTYNYQSGAYNIVKEFFTPYILKYMHFPPNFFKEMELFATEIYTNMENRFFMISIPEIAQAKSDNETEKQEKES